MENLEKVFRLKKKYFILQHTCSSKESATLANRLIEGQVLNAQYAEESYQLKRDNSTFKKQIDEINQSLTIKQISSSNLPPITNNDELEMLHERINSLTAVRLAFEMIFIIPISLQRKIVDYKIHLIPKSLPYKKN